MTIKQRVHQLLDALPEETTYDEIIDSLTRLRRQELAAKIEAFHDNAPEEDEEITAEEWADIRAGQAEIRRGQSHTLAEVEQELFGHPLDS